MHDLFTEIWSSVRRNKLRTILTGLAVSWGIFIIILLLGAGNGMMNAFMKQSHDFATNTMESLIISTKSPLPFPPTALIN